MANKIKDIAKLYINLWLKHDKKKYDECIDILMRINSILFPNMSKIKIRKTAKLMIDAFKIHDDIEENGKGEWRDILTPLKEYYNVLEIPKEAASYTMNVWKSHNDKDFSFLLKSLINEQKFLSKKIIGTDKFSLELAGFWFVAAAAHDIKDIDTGIMAMNAYFSILLQNSD